MRFYFPLSTASGCLPRPCPRESLCTSLFPHLTKFPVTLYSLLLQKIFLVHVMRHITEEVKLHLVLTWAVNGGQRPNSRPNSFNLRQRSVGVSTPVPKLKMCGVPPPLSHSHSKGSKAICRHISI